jgi:hypothetical protein
MVQRKTRFFEADEEALHAVFEAYTDSALKEEDNEESYVDPKTEEDRERIWLAWTEYVLSTRFPGFSILVSRIMY